MDVRHATHTGQVEGLLELALLSRMEGKSARECRRLQKAGCIRRFRGQAIAPAVPWWDRTLLSRRAFRGAGNVNHRPGTSGVPGPAFASNPPTPAAGSLIASARTAAPATAGATTRQPHRGHATYSSCGSGGWMIAVDLLPVWVSAGRGTEPARHDGPCERRKRGQKKAALVFVP